MTMVLEVLPLPVTLPTLEYWPALAVAVTTPAEVNCQVSPGSNRLFVLESPTLNPPDRTGAAVKSLELPNPSPPSSVTTTFLIGSLLPVAVTLYVQVIGVPTGKSSPGAVSLLVPLVSLTIWINGVGIPSTCVPAENEPSPGVL